jgi:hypothetical protein
MLPRFEPKTEYIVPADVTAVQLTMFVDQLVDEQVNQLAPMYRRLIEDIERSAEQLTDEVREGWLRENRPAVRAGDPEAIRRRLAELPERPQDDDRSDIIECRSAARTRGVYLRLTSGCFRNADMRAYDRHGEMIDRVFAIDDPLVRLGVAQFLWEELQWSDPQPRGLLGRRRNRGRRAR